MTQPNYSSNNEHLRQLARPDVIQFQTENMKHKIRNVHKKKKKHNYKNIETLENINDNTSTIIEGMNVLPIATFDENDWTGGDNIYEGTGTQTPTTNTIGTGLVDLIVEKIKVWIDYTAIFITNPLTKKDDYKTPLPRDAQVIRKYIVWGIALLVSSISIYNWAYLMIYKDRGNRIEVYDISRDRLKAASSNGKIYELLDFLLDIPTFFPEKLQEYLLFVIPDYATCYIGVIAFYVLLFALITTFYYTSAGSILTMISDIGTFNMKNYVLVFLYATSLLLYVLSFFDVQLISTAFSIVTLIAGFPTSLIRVVFANIFKIFFILMFAVPIAATMCLLYLFVFSFFAIIIFGGFSNVFNIITDIDNYIKSKQIPIKPNTICHPLTIFDRLLNLVYKTLNFIGLNVVKIGYIVMLLVSGIEYAKKINHPVLKFVLIILNGFAIVILGERSYSYYMEPAEKVEEEPPLTNELDNIGYMDAINADINTATTYLKDVYDKMPIPNITEITAQIPTLEKVKEVYSKIPEFGENIQTTIAEIGDKYKPLQAGDSLNVQIQQPNVTTQ